MSKDIGFFQDEQGNKSHIRLSGVIGQLCALLVTLYGIHRGCDLFGLSFIIAAFISPVGFKAWQKKYEKGEEGKSGCGCKGIIQNG